VSGYVVIERRTGERTVLRRRYPDLLLAISALSSELGSSDGCPDQLARLDNLRIEDLPFEAEVGGTHWRLSA
jgi:hypothetical protein